jgi:ferredoxin
MAKIEAQIVNGVEVIDAPAGKKLVLAIEDAGIDILHRCGGNARCTTCRVEVLQGDPGEMRELERNRLAMEADLAPNIRLSCQIRVNEDLRVRVINQASIRGLDPGPRPLDE